MVKEKHSTAVLSPTFPLSLKEALVGIGANDQNNAGGVVGEVLIGEFRADSLMAGRYIK